MHKVWRDIGLRQNSLEQPSILWQEVAMIRVRVVPGKHGMSALMLALKEAEIIAEAISVNMHHEHIETKQLKYKVETPTGKVHAGYIQQNHNTTSTHRGRVGV